MARVFTVSSGSNGNCTYIGDAESGILIDVGVSFSRVKNALLENNIDLSNLEALFITHEHSDHIKSLGSLSKKFDLPVFANQETFDAMPKQVEKISSAYINLAPKSMNMILNHDIIVIIPNSSSSHIATFTNKQVSFSYNTSLNLRFCKRHLFDNR
mgnify:CR=1 FL=1